MLLLLFIVVALTGSLPVPALQQTTVVSREAEVVCSCGLTLVVAVPHSCGNSFAKIVSMEFN